MKRHEPRRLRTRSLQKSNRNAAPNPTCFDLSLAHFKYSGYEIVFVIYCHQSVLQSVTDYWNGLMYSIIKEKEKKKETSIV